MKSILKLCFGNFIVLALAYYAYVESNMYCENIFVFFTWIVFLITLLVYLLRDTEEIRNAMIGQKKDVEIQLKISNMFTGILCLFLIAFGHWVIAIVWILKRIMWYATKTEVYNTLEGR